MYKDTNYWCISTQNIRLLVLKLLMYQYSNYSCIISTHKGAAHGAGIHSALIHEVLRFFTHISGAWGRAYFVTPLACLRQKVLSMKHVQIELSEAKSTLYKTRSHRAV